MRCGTFHWSAWPCKRCDATRTASGNSHNANYIQKLINDQLRALQTDVSEDAGEIYKTIHCLRHTFKDRLRKTNAREELIDAILGHSSRKPDYGYIDLESEAGSHEPTRILAPIRARRATPDQGLDGAWISTRLRADPLAATSGLAKPTRATHISSWSGACPRPGPFQLNGLCSRRGPFAHLRPLC